MNELTFLDSLWLLGHEKGSAMGRGWHYWPLCIGLKPAVLPDISRKSPIPDGTHLNHEPQIINYIECKLYTNYFKKYKVKPFKYIDLLWRAVQHNLDQGLQGAENWGTPV